MTPKDILAIEIGESDSGARTVGGYLVALLDQLWLEGECFSGKRPFGNSGWEYDLARALIKAGAIKGTLDNDGYVMRVDNAELAQTIKDAIKELGKDYE